MTPAPQVVCMGTCPFEAGELGAEALPAGNEGRWVSVLTRAMTGRDLGLLKGGLEGFCAPQAWGSGQQCLLEGLRRQTPVRGPS